MAEPELVLKTTPPRMHRTATPRARLSRLWADVRDHMLVSVSAPAGFGKTTLLTQWRRLWFEHGAIVAWVTLDKQDDSARFAKALLLAMRVASGRASFDKIALQYAGQPDRGLDMLTALLSEVAALATPTVLMLDDAERLPQDTVRDALAYLLLNAPSNLHVVIGSRAPLPLPVSDLAARGDFAELKTSDLRLDADECFEILRRRFGERITLDDCARMHDTTEGWPLGLQLAAAAIERAPDLHQAIESLSGRHADIERYFIESLLARLTPTLAQFLTRIAILDDISPDLCTAVTGVEAAPAYLGELMSETPIVMAAELRGWIRIHPLARDFLLGVFTQLPDGEKRALHLRAANWLAQHERFHEAGRHALAAGDPSLAQTCAKSALWDLASRGRLNEARSWLDALPDEVIADDDHLRLVAAWILALGDRPDDAFPIAEKILRKPGAAAAIQFEAALVATCAACYADRPGLIPALLAPWPNPPQELQSVVHIIAHANTQAVVAIFDGETERVRRLLLPLIMRPHEHATALACAIGHGLVCLSHLADGNAYKAEASLLAPLADAERDAGRRCAAAGLLSPLLATALLERGNTAGAQAVLADRLDVIERAGFPDGVLMAHRTLARLALDGGDERRAFEILDNLHAIGEVRGMPRMILASCVEQARIHALRQRGETVDALIVQIAKLSSRFSLRELAPLRPHYDLDVAITRAYAALTRYDLAGAEEALRSADRFAARLHRKRDILTIMVLRAVVARQRNDARALPLLTEALGLAAIGGNVRLLADTHPLAVQMLAEEPDIAGPMAALPRKPSNAKTIASPGSDRPVVKARPAAPTGLLTPKEAEVIRLLNDGMSNKMIARTLDVSDETVKWHLKNLFSKLNAGTRRHAVDRARLLGLLMP